MVPDKGDNEKPNYERLLVEDTIIDNIFKKVWFQTRRNIYGDKPDT